MPGFKNLFALLLIFFAAAQSYAIAWDQARHSAQAMGFAVDGGAHLDDGVCNVCQDHQPSGSAPVRASVRFDLLPVERSVEISSSSFIPRAGSHWHLSRGPPAILA